MLNESTYERDLLPRTNEKIQTLAPFDSADISSTERRANFNDGRRRELIAFVCTGSRFRLHQQLGSKVTVQESVSCECYTFTLHQGIALTVREGLLRPASHSRLISQVGKAGSNNISLLNQLSVSN